MSFFVFFLLLEKRKKRPSSKTGYEKNPGKGTIRPSSFFQVIPCLSQMRNFSGSRACNWELSGWVEMKSWWNLYGFGFDFNSYSKKSTLSLSNNIIHRLHFLITLFSFFMVSESFSLCKTCQHEVFGQFHQPWAVILQKSKITIADCLEQKKKFLFNET